MISNIKVIKGDITTLRVDAIVNAAKPSLLGGGGVDGAIHRAAGPELLEECKTLGGCQVGGAKITKGYLLPAKYVIHTVGPVWQGGVLCEQDLLCYCYISSLIEASKKNIQENKEVIKSIAFPCISTGIYGFPAELAAILAIDAVKDVLEYAPFDVTFCCFLDSDYELYRANGVGTT